MQPWTQSEHLSCTVQVDSAFYSQWDGKMIISFRVE